MTTAVSPLDLLPGARRALLQRIKVQGGLSAGDAARTLDITVAGVRPHLSGLVRAGLLACTRVSEGPGRPRHLYTLTPEGDALFPRRYGEMARELLEYVEELKPGLLPDLFARRAHRRLLDAQRRIGSGSLGDRVRELARILDEDGYLAEVAPLPEGGFLLIERNCPVLTVAQRHGHACSSEIDFLREALPDARVQRVSHILRGAPACAYEIVPRDVQSTSFRRSSMAYPFSLPDLGFAFDALEPHIDARTMEIHHGKHHAGYTKNLNSALEGHGAFHGYSGEQLLRGLHSVPQEIRTAVRNNGGGFVNHALFWEILTPGGSTTPQGDLAAAIDQTFGSFDDLKSKVNDAAAKQFGSGWGWLAVSPFGELQVLSTANQDSPLIDGSTPILGVDVWEHAYYLHYQNRRPDYLSAIWNVINWDVVGEKYAEARGGWIRTV